jgi:hypothetical protein
MATSDSPHITPTADTAIPTPAPTPTTTTASDATNSATLPTAVPDIINDATIALPPLLHIQEEPKTHPKPTSDIALPLIPVPVPLPTTEIPSPPTKPTTSSTSTAADSSETQLIPTPPLPLPLPIVAPTGKRQATEEAEQTKPVEKKRKVFDIFEYQYPPEEVCQICQVNAPNTTASCGHTVLCSVCSKKLAPPSSGHRDRCVLCQQPIDFIVYHDSDTTCIPGETPEVKQPSLPAPSTIPNSSNQSSTSSTSTTSNSSSQSSASSSSTTSNAQPANAPPEDTNLYQTYADALADLARKYMPLPPNIGMLTIAARKAWFQRLSEWHERALEIADESELPITVPRRYIINGITYTNVLWIPGRRDQTLAVDGKFVVIAPPQRTYYDD